MDLQKKFWDKIEKTNTCWLWKAGGTKHGYGTFYHEKSYHYAHRYSYEVHHGSLNAGELVMHSCDNPKCVNPEHLSAGNKKLNAIDAANKGRLNQKQRAKSFISKFAPLTTCKRGHDVTKSENQYTYKNGKIDCRQCRSFVSAAYYQKMKNR